MLIPIPVATEHRVRVTGDFEIDFKCQRCGEKARARVYATSVGTAMGLPLSVSASGPIDRAKAKAVDGLPKEARELVELARCLACRRRSREAIKGWWIVHTVQVAFVLAIFVLPLAYFDRDLLSPDPVGIAFVLALAYLGARFFVRLWQVDRRVVFGSRP